MTDSYNQNNINLGSEDGAPLGEYTNAFFVDPQGNPAANGRDPAIPTTFANAMSQVVDSSLVVLAPGTYSDGDGPGAGTTTISANTVTLFGMQGGGTAASAILTDDVVINAGVSETRLSGLQLPGDITDNGATGPISIVECSAASGDLVRNSPIGLMAVIGCDFLAKSYTSSGGNGGVFTLSGGSTRFGTITNSTPNHVLSIFSVQRTDKITFTSTGTILAQLLNILDGARPIDAPSAVVSLVDVTVGDSAGVPRPVTVGTHLFQQVTYEPAGSVLGTALGFLTYFTGIGYIPADPGNWAATPPDNIADAIDRLIAANPGA